MNRTYKFRLKPNKRQCSILNEWIGTCRFVYNNALEHRICSYKSCGTSPTWVDQANELSLIKKTIGLEWIGDVYSQVLVDVIKRLDKSYKNFFRGGGFPSFASKGSFKSFTYSQLVNLKIDDKRVKLPKIGYVKFIKHRDIEGTPKTITIKNENNKWYICICVNFNPSKSNGDSQAIGIDVGVKKLAALSNGDFYENPRFLKKFENKLRLKQKKLSRQKRFGKNWNKTKFQISKLHSDISNRRKDHLHKLSKKLTSKYNIIVVEDLNLKNMIKKGRNKKALNKSLIDSSLGVFLNQVKYKTEFQGGTVISVNPAYTSQTCFNCGFVSRKNRKSQSKFKCIDCGYFCNADTNAAKNILSAGLALLSLT